MKVTLNVYELKASRKGASVDESRYILNGVYVECRKGKQPRLVSTDGRLLILIESTAAEAVEDGEMIIPSGLLDEVFKLAVAEISFETTKDSTIIATCVTKRCSQLKFEVNALDGNYPNYRQALPRFPLPEPLTVNYSIINPFLLGKIAYAAKILNVNAEFACLRFIDHLSPICVNYEPLSNFYAVIMPGRTSNIGQPPQFVKDLLNEKTT
jgi:hypothetical protein